MLTRIAYVIGAPGRTELAVYDALGRRVRLLERGWRNPGSYACSWDRRTDGGVRLARGVYLVRLEVAGQLVARKLVLARE